MRAFLIALLGLPALAVAGDSLSVTGALDARWVHGSGDTSFLNGGSGVLRFDPGHDEVRFGRAFASAKLRLTDTVSLHTVLDAYGDQDRNAVDVSEAWLEYRPFPTNALRWRLRAGAFYLPTSLENRGPGWSSVYTITPSAINTWYGEELRTIGAEVEARWLGASQGYAGDIALVAAAYGWNDPAGTVIADRGFGMTDRPSTLFGGLGRPREGLYHEIDKRPGYYGGLSWRHGDWLELRTLYYDNRGDPAAETKQGFAWLTRFASAGLRLEPSAPWTLIAQYVDGYTVIGDLQQEGWVFRMNFRGAFALASFEHASDRLTLRRDQFRTTQVSRSRGAPANQDGHAWTLGWTHRFNDTFEVATEWIRASSTFPPRVESGTTPFVRASQMQVALRYRFKGEW